MIVTQDEVMEWRGTSKNIYVSVYVSPRDRAQEQIFLLGTIAIIVITHMIKFCNWRYLLLHSYNRELDLIQVSRCTWGDVVLHNFAAI